MIFIFNNRTEKRRESVLRLKWRFTLRENTVAENEKTISEIQISVSISDFKIGKKLF